jgi:allantoin racemase
MSVPQEVAYEGGRGVKIRVITPSTMREKVARSIEQYSAAARSDTQLSADVLDKGPESVDSVYDEAMAAADTVKKIEAAEQEGIQAVISNCMLDPGVLPAREKVFMPVLGPAESSMHVAAMLADRFSVVTILDALIPAFENHALKLGLFDQLASVRAVSMRGADLDDQERLQKAIEELAAKAVEEDGAHIIVLGCTAMRGLAMDVEEGLRKRGITGVPVIDPALLSLKLAEAFVDMGLSHSKLTYPEPPQQEIIGF